MYKLYYLPDACSLASQVVLRELEQDLELVNIQNINDFAALNPVATVPVLLDKNLTLREGAAVIIYLLEKHKSHMLPSEPMARSVAIRDIMFANATMHPAYSRLFFIANTSATVEAKQEMFDSAAQSITALWDVVEDQLQGQAFLGGNNVSAADIMLTVYSRWAASFPVNISLGVKTSQMIEAVLALPSFQQSLHAEHQQSAA